MGDVKALYILPEQFESSLKEALDPIARGLQAGLSSYNERVRCSRLFGGLAKQVFRHVLIVLLDHIIKPSLTQIMAGRSRPQRMAILTVMMRQSLDLVRGLLEHDRDHLLEDFSMDWHVSSIFDQFVVEYEAD